MPLILLRHTEPEGCAGLCYGRTDVPLQPDFESRAAAIEATLPVVVAVVTSPLARCRSLARWIGTRRLIPVTEDPRIAEMDFGNWEARSWNAIPRQELEAWAADILNARPHGGESVTMLLNRVEAALAEWRRGSGTVLLVSHAGVAKAAQALSGADEPWSFRLDFGEWIRL